MKKVLLCCLLPALLLVGCGSNPEPGVVEAPAPSPSETAAPPQRLWASESDGSHSVKGYIEQSGTGISFRYEVEIEGPAERMIVAYPGEDGLIAESARLHGESLRTGYLSMGDPDPDMPMWKRPMGVMLIVEFKRGEDLIARLRREPIDKEERKAPLTRAF